MSQLKSLPAWMLHLRATMKVFRHRDAGAVFSLGMLCILAMLPTAGMAFSLGKGRVLSALDEPVGVEIEVLQWQADDLDLVEVSLGSREDFAAFDLEYVDYLDEISFRVMQPGDDKLVILMIGQTPLQEPVLDILIRVRWPGGSLLREYILLFDPRS